MSRGLQEHLITEIPYFGANFWEDWERPIHFSFYEKETGDLGVAFNTGVKIYGAWSRGQNAQRSLAVFARGKYGTSEFDYPFFEKRSAMRSSRPWCCGTQDKLG